MSRPNKQTVRLYNMLKKQRMAVGYIYSDDCLCRIVDHTTGRDIPVKQEYIHAMSKISYKWGVLIAVICKDESGKKYMKSEYIKAKQPYMQSELAGFLEDQHKALIEGANTNHVIDVAWLASPLGKEWNEAEAFKIFERMAA